jgi:kumamolisin
MSNEMVRLQGSLPPTIQPSDGPVDPHARIEVTVKLRRKTQTGIPTLDEFLVGKRAVGVDRQALIETYGASREDADAVAAWAQGQGLSVAATDLGLRQVRLVGTAAAVGRAFAVSLTVHTDSRTGLEYRSHDTDLSIPTGLKDVITGVFGLDTRQVTVRHERRMDRRALTDADPKESFPGSFYPTDVAELYNFPPTTGAGQKVAILEFGGAFDQAELQSYFTGTLGFDTAPTTNALFVLGAQMEVDDENTTGEVYLDIEVVGGMAPGAVIDVYFAPWGADGYLTAVETALRNDDYAAISISYGLDEDLASTAGTAGWDMLNNAVDLAFSEAAAIGVPVFVSTGDQGSGSGRGSVKVQGRRFGITYETPELHACYPATSPYATAVGGTQLYAEDGAIAAEVVWNELGGPIRTHYFDATGAPKTGNVFRGGATGGGVSRHYTTPPSYQTKAGITLRSGNTPPAAGRCIPDVAGNSGASTGYVVTQPPSSELPLAPVGGTSAAAPMWAALMARVREALATSLGGTIPTFFLNDFIYANGTSGAFRDITQGREFSYPPDSPGGVAGDFTPTGTNRSSTADGYDTRVGYDLCTGWGSPDGVALVAQLRAWLQANPPAAATGQQAAGRPEAGSDPLTPAEAVPQGS